MAGTFGKLITLLALLLIFVVWLMIFFANVSDVSASNGGSWSTSKAWIIGLLAVALLLVLLTLFTGRKDSTKK